MTGGLSQKELLILSAIFEKYKVDGEVILYGSRAKGTYTERSDVDLVIKNSSVRDDQLLATLQDEIEESDFPYLVDLQFYEKIQNPALLDHINRRGIVVYRREKNP
ncbi:MAG: nucleotidyltransferase domain-containing protein [Treponemataceae bacterium]|nr:nucleotidyltransferase domain-containing protein [Treponemataceae bacterium]